MTSMVASAAAQHTGLPLVVKMCAGKLRLSMMSALPTMADSGRPLASDFPTDMRSGSTPNCSMPHHFPVRPMPWLISSTANRMPFSRQNAVSAST